MNNDLISREALKENGTVIGIVNGQKMKVIPLSFIDNTPEVPSNMTLIPTAVLDDLTKTTRELGEWIIVKDEKWGNNVKCPFCGKELAGTDLNFCCKCGARLTTPRNYETE